MIKKYLLFIRISIELDYRTLRFKPMKFSHRLEFIFKKYVVIFKHMTIKKFALGQHVRLAGKNTYYDSSLGIAGYQSMITRHYRLLQCADAFNPKIIFDCGANVGFYSMFTKAMYPYAAIYSFEPVGIVYELLSKNLQGMKQVETYNLALSDGKYSKKMRFNKDDSVTSKIVDDGDVTIRTETLDNFCLEKNIEYIDLLKIDTEGHEVEVLMGAQKTLSRVKYIVLEVNLLEDEYTISTLLSYLTGNDFDFQLVAYRNYSGNSEGKIEIMDILLKNTKIK